MPQPPQFMVSFPLMLVQAKLVVPGTRHEVCFLSLHMHLPREHLELAPQLLPQAPQLLGSLLVFTQLSPHATSPRKRQVQTPFLHCWVAPQVISQAPQALLLNITLVQTPSQSANPVFLHTQVLLALSQTSPVLHLPHMRKEAASTSAADSTSSALLNRGAAATKSRPSRARQAADGRAMVYRYPAQSNM
jgi:hypothetical protein